MQLLPVTNFYSPSLPVSCFAGTELDIGWGYVGMTMCDPSVVCCQSSTIVCDLQAHVHGTSRLAERVGCCLLSVDPLKY